MLVQNTMIAWGFSLATSRMRRSMVSGPTSEKAKLTFRRSCVSATHSKPSRLKLATILSWMSSVYGETMPKRRTPDRRKISSIASTDEQAGIPGRCVIFSHSCRSVWKPSQPAEVPFQQIEWQRASASSSAADSIGSSVNWPSAWSESEISVTRKRPKWPVTPGTASSMRETTGSSVVFEDGVSMPRNRRLLRLTPAMVARISPWSSSPRS